MTEYRITELEIKMVYQEDLLQALDKIVHHQQQQIGRLETTCKVLNDRLKSLSTQGSDNEGIEEPPPHY